MKNVRLGIGLSLLLVACGKGTEPVKEAGAPPPGRGTAVVCAPSPLPTLRPLSDGGTGPCVVDSDCETSTVEGHCAPNPDAGPNLCAFDQCLRDSDCGDSGVCACQYAVRGVSINTCLRSDCRVDADCGSGGTCSPTVDSSCGPYFGVVGYYCHTLSDECATDADCANDIGTFPAYCAYDSTVAHWICSTGRCAG